MKKIIGSHKGMSLIEVMVATAIMGALAIGFIRMMENQTSSMNYIEARNSEADLARQVQLLLSDPVACKNSFQVLDAINAPYVLDESAGEWIKDKNGAEFLRTGAEVGTGSMDLQVTSITLENIDVPTPPVTAPATKTGTMWLIIATDRIKKIVGAPSKTTKSLMAVTVDENDEIIECSHSSQTVEATEFCINGVCRTTFSAADGQCGPNQVVLRITNGGSVECADMSCPAGEVMYGLDTNVGVLGDKVRARVMCQPAP